MISDRFSLHPPITMRRSAEISECGLYRWSLRRAWTNRDDDPPGVVCFVMLNPSTADGQQDDPTIRRCIGFAQRWGYSSLVVRNLFAFRATDPAKLLTAENPTGGKAGDCALLAALQADLVVVAWGASVPFGRDSEALRMFETHGPGKPLYCLGRTKTGNPRHPLYVRGDAEIERLKTGDGNQ